MPPDLVLREFNPPSICLVLYCIDGLNSALGPATGVHSVPLFAPCRESSDTLSSPLSPHSLESLQASSRPLPRPQISTLDQELLPGATKI